MGQRAKLVIVRGGAWRLYYDHWCANRLDVELFWGPALQTLQFWLANPSEDIFERVQRAWPAWKVHWLRNDFAAQLSLAKMNIQLPERSSTELTQLLLDHLERQMDHRQKNLARDLPPRLGSAVINPWTDEARSSSGTPQKKLEVLAALRNVSR